jgi:predicted dehydrogenase
MPSSSRRRFLQATSTAAAATTGFFTSGSAARGQSPNERPRVAVVGCGGQGTGDGRQALAYGDIVAVCDVDTAHTERAKTIYSEHPAAKGRGGEIAVFDDYRAVIDSKDIDAVICGTVDHWHVKIAAEAMKAGKDVYCEKPLTLTIDEGKLIRRVQKETGRIVQVGTQQRSTFNLFTKAMAIVAEGRLGRITQVQAAIGGAPSSPSIPVADVPKGLDWDRWLGPAPACDYRFQQGPATKDKNGKERRPPANTNCHYEFRWWYEYSGGKLTDWGAHHVDVAIWALALNGQTAGPTAIGGTAVHPVSFRDGVAVEKDRYNTATAFFFNVDFPGGTKLFIRNDTDNGVLIEGEKGRMFVSRGKLSGGPVDALKDNPLPEDAIAKVYKNLPMEHDERKGHWANFLRCAKERKEPISDVHSHMKMLNVCHLAGISARLGRSLAWDDAKEQIVGDEQANAMLARPYRKGYEIDMG